MRMRWKQAIVMHIFVVFLLGTICTSGAETKTWNGNVSTNWADGANWTGGLPGAGDDVVVPAGTSLEPFIPAGTNPLSGVYASFTIHTGATVTCLGDTTAINEASGGVSGNPHGMGVTIFCTNAAIHGTLTAYAQGFPILQGPGYGGSGASHGGRGGSGVTYGSLTHPTALGSGTSSGPGRCGGGSIRVAASETLSVNGLIDASAPAMPRSGSGGSIWLTASNFTGSGVIRADGGSSTAGFSGAGGRIALGYTNSSFNGIVSVAGGLYGTTFNAQPGTLWDPGRWPTGSPEAPAVITITDGCQYWFPDAAPTNYWDLTISNAWFEPHHGALQLSNLVLTNAAFRFDKYAEGQPASSDMDYLEIDHDLRLTGTSVAYLCPRDYVLAGDLVVGADAVLYFLSDTTAINPSSGGTAGRPHGIGATIRCADATIDGELNADGLGFLGARGPGAGGNSGGHGGQGGSVALSRAYGVLARPSALGSGGSSVRPGGGAIRITVANTLTLNGAILASAPDSNAYTGSGGSVWLTASTLSGNGSITARGGDCASDNVSGGGGRIALFSTTDAFTGAVCVDPGTVPGTASTGKTGTLFRCTSPVAECGANDAPGVQVTSGFGVNSNGVTVLRQVSKWSRSFRWADESLDTESNGVNNVAQYTLSGLPPNTLYTVFVNGDPVASRTNSGTSGTLFLDDITLSPSVEVAVDCVNLHGSCIIIR